MQIVRHTVKEHVGSSSYPMLTRACYTRWPILMRVKMQAQGIWDPMKHDVRSDREERNALTVILQSVPPEMLRVIAAKDNARDAWNVVRTIRVGVEC